MLRQELEDQLPDEIQTFIFCTIRRLMKDYDVVYIDKEGDKQDFVVTAINTSTAIANTLELCPDCRRVIRCAPKPMFND